MENNDMDYKYENLDQTMLKIFNEAKEYFEPGVSGKIEKNSRDHTFDYQLVSPDGLTVKDSISNEEIDEHIDEIRDYFRTQLSAKILLDVGQWEYEEDHFPEFLKINGFTSPKDKFRLKSLHDNEDTLTMSAQRIFLSTVFPNLPIPAKGLRIFTGDDEKSIRRICSVIEQNNFNFKVVPKFLSLMTLDGCYCVEIFFVRRNTKQPLKMRLFPLDKMKISDNPDTRIIKYFEQFTKCFKEAVNDFDKNVIIKEHFNTFPKEELEGISDSLDKDLFAYKDLEESLKDLMYKL